MKQHRKPLVFCLLLAAVLCFCALSGCNESGIENISQNINEYTISVDYDGAKDTAACRMTVTYVNKSEALLDELMFHLYPNAYREGARFSPVAEPERAAAYPMGVHYGGIAVTAVSAGEQAIDFSIEGQDEDILVVPLERELMPSAKTTLTIDFTLTVPCVRHRFGRYDGRINLGNWYPIACVYEDGGFVTDPYYSNGDPFYSEIANYHVTVTAPKRYTVASSGASTRTEDGETATTVTFQRAARDFALVLGEFSCKEAAVGETAVTYYYRSDADPDASLKAAVDALETFGALFGAYPYATYAVVETCFLQGGMEYPALTYISDQLNESLYIEAIVHETAHQWWYAVVGNNEVSDAWMDEGLTEYTTTVFYEQNPDYEVDAEKRITDALSAYILYYDSFKFSGKDTSMNRRLGEYADHFEYTYMTYVKGELMFEQLRHLIGDASYFGGLRAYYETYYLKNATPDGLIACFEKSSGRELKSFFDSFLEGKVQMYGGFARD